MTYLGTDLSPNDYYGLHADDYYNLHQIAISELLQKYKVYLSGKVLDLGCGDGLVSKLLPGFAWCGSDREPSMIARYERETEYPGIVCEFWDPQPECDTIVAVHSLHLCPESRSHEMWYRLHETGAKHVVIITPLKSRPQIRNPYFRLLDRSVGHDLAKGKTIYGMLLEMVEL